MEGGRHEDREDLIRSSGVVVFGENMKMVV